jgi:hypothetical protein
MSSILKSPLTHFAVLGGLIFAAYALLSDAPAAPSEGVIEMSERDARLLAEQFAATWNRPPTEAELRGMMQAWVLEEAYVREARSLGLDQGDAVIRQRLKLKMEFLAESDAARLEPSDADLQAFLDANADRFAKPLRLSFEQILLPSGAGEEDVAATLAELRQGARPSEIGATNLLPPRLDEMAVVAIDRVFGVGFGDALAGQPLGHWSGPIRSGYGQHLVRVSERSEAALPSLSDIRERVEAEWRSVRARDSRDAFSDSLLGRYSITLPDASAVLTE